MTSKAQSTMQEAVNLGLLWLPSAHTHYQQWSSSLEGIACLSHRLLVG